MVSFTDPHRLNNCSHLSFFTTSLPLPTSCVTVRQDDLSVWRLDKSCDSKLLLSTPDSRTFDSTASMLLISTGPSLISPSFVFTYSNAFAPRSFEHPICDLGRSAFQKQRANRYNDQSDKRNASHSHSSQQCSSKMKFFFRSRHTQL